MLDSDTLLSSLRSLKNTLPPLWLWLKLIQSDSNLFIHTYLMMAAIWNSAISDSDIAMLDSDTLLSSLRSLKNTLPPLWLWLKLFQTDSN